jgi:hypothetical protein
MIVFNIIRCTKNKIKGTVSGDFLLLVFFMNKFSQSPCVYHKKGPFRIFSKIRGDIRSSRFTTGIIDTGGKFETVLMGYSGAGGKLIHEKNQEQ